MPVYAQLQQGHAMTVGGIGLQGLVEDAEQGGQYQDPQDQIDQQMIEQTAHWPRMSFLNWASTPGAWAASWVQFTFQVGKLPILAITALAGIPARAG